MCWPPSENNEERKFRNSIPCISCHAAKFLTPTARVPCSNAGNIGEHKTLTQSEFCTSHNSVRGQEPTKVYTQYTSTEDGQTSCKVSLTPVERLRCSDEAKTRNPLKFAGVPRTHQPISAASGPKFTILWGHVQEILQFNRFFSDCRYMP